MSRLLFILAALPIALANFLPTRREHSDCFSDQIFCSSTDFGAYAQVIWTDDWLANATTIHDLLGLRKPGSFAPRNVGKFEPLCCPVGYSICGLLLPGDIPACYYSSGDLNRADMGPLFYLSDMSYGFANTGDYFNMANDHINLITGDYNYANGNKGNWFVDRGEKRPAATTHTMEEADSTISRIVSITRTLVNFPTGTNSASRKSFTLTGNTAISTTSDQVLQTSTIGAPTSTDGAANAQVNEGAGMSLVALVRGKAMWMAGAAVVLGYTL
ncbi:hypothetical protein V496_00535 [Pseudogymnoascus sp. VKM F-4515 (FW-2607)]|nr:hypothetical protein V496_00535 [Pseudogymnoascus sp. VKM F-4515 (FW-2607)]